jgi:FKBP-type peptidyl-prolyl cis-trans isomerase FklB
MKLKCIKWIAVLGVGLLAAQGSAEETIVLKDQMSYAVGADMARNFKWQGVELELDHLVTGLRDVFSGEKLLMTDEDLRQAMKAYQNEMNRKDVEAKRMAPNVSYAVGADAARNLKRQGVELDLDLLVKGLRDVFSGAKLLMPDSELRRSVNLYQNEVRQNRTRARTMLARGGRNSGKEGEVFLAANKTKEGVVTLPSGLQYKILKEGDGRKPTEADTVEVNYRGTLIDGTEFDSSYRAGKPANFKLAEVIPGWKEALRLMPVGSKWQIYVPPALTSGPRAAAMVIPPNQALIYEVELLAIK